MDFCAVYGRKNLIFMAFGTITKEGEIWTEKQKRNCEK